jgi:menaquinone-dependent protoporphyrinogen oxidase
MHVLVAYASRHGATAGIAQRLADDLVGAGLEAEARPVDEVRDVAGYDAFVIGSAAYMTRWLKEASSFVKRHQADLVGHPVWLFSSGPIGTDLVDKQGRDVVEASRPREFAELEPVLHPRDERVFFGAWDPMAPGRSWGERLVRIMPARVLDEMPAGDFRDWPAIDAWAAEIAGELKVATPA